MTNKESLIRFGVSMPQKLTEQLDVWADEVGYHNRSEAIRDLVRKALLDCENLKPDALVAGTLVMVYNHHATDLSALLTELQHQYYRDIVSTMHIHLNHDQCLEAVVLRGKMGRLRELSQQIQVQKGVLYADLSVTHIDAHKD